jgi:hypothetical protein
MMEELLERYFEGETSAAEEKLIRAFFASGEVPEHLTAYIPLFAYFDEEIERNAEVQDGKTDSNPESVSVPLRPENRKRSALYILSGVAACVLALLSLTRLLYPADPCFCSDNYVVINGRCYTDIHKVRSLAIEALQEVATSADDYFPEMDKEEEADRQIIDNQLKELGSLFSEDE